MEKERIIEVLISLMLIVLVFIMILIGLNSGSNSKISYQTTNNYYINQKTDTSKNYETSYEKDYYFQKYDSYGKHLKKDLGAYYIDEYTVYISNPGKGDYFTAKFYFEDCWGFQEEIKIRKFVETRDTEIFYFRDFSRDKCTYDSWTYKVSHRLA